MSQGASRRSLSPARGSATVSAACWCPANKIGESGSATDTGHECPLRRISKAPSNSPTPDLYLGKAVSNDDRDALATHARNRLQSDHDDRCQDSRRHFSLVAEPATKEPLLHLGSVTVKEKSSSAVDAGQMSQLS
jgi:hypothetical protein